MNDDIEDGLTPQERQALEINDDDGPEEVIPGAEAAAAMTTTDKGDDETKKDDQPGAGDGADPAPGADAAGKPAAEAAAAPAPEPEAAASPAAQPAPILVAEAVADADAKLADISAKKEALDKQFDDGNITYSELRTQLDDLNKQERAIERAQDKAQMASEMAEQQKMNAWFNQAQTFAKDNGYTDTRRLNMLDAEVRQVATAEPNLTGTEVLAKAHQNLVDAGLATAKAASKPATAAPPAKAKAVELPPSIHKLPAADVDDTGAGEFAQLDRLATTNPLKYEETLASMSEAQRERYLAA